MNSAVASPSVDEDARTSIVQTDASARMGRTVPSTGAGECHPVLDRLTIALLPHSVLPQLRPIQGKFQLSLLGGTLLRLVTVPGTNVISAGDSGGQAHFSATTSNTEHANTRRKMSQTPTYERLFRLQRLPAIGLPSRSVNPVNKASALHRDRRAFPRHESPSTVSVVLCGQQRSVSLSERAWLLRSSRLKGPLLDISMNGVAFILSEPIAADENLLLRVSNPHLDRHVETSAHVVRTAPVDDGKWKVFCQFHQKLKLEQIHDVGKHLFQSALV